MRIKGMTYEEFIKQYRMRAHEELGYDLERMKFYPEGYTSDDPAKLEWIRDSNLRYTGEENTKLLTDILIMEVPANGNESTLHRIAIRQDVRICSALFPLLCTGMDGNVSAEGK